MDSSAEMRPQSPSPNAFPGGKSLAWIAGVCASLIASVLAAVLAVALAATVLVVAVMGGALLAVGALALRARRAVRERGAEDDGPQLLEARHVGGHSWVAYGWDRRR
jgi:hypothetical protein